MQHLLLMPHFDDETFSCFGYLSQVKHENVQAMYGFEKYELCDKYYSNFLSSNVTVFTFCKGLRGFKIDRRFETYKKILNALNINCIVLNYCDLYLHVNPIHEYIDIVSDFLKNYSNVNVVIPSENDLHQEHKLINSIGKISCKRNLSRINKILEVKQPFENFDTTNYNRCLDVNASRKKDFCSRYSSAVHALQYYDKEFYRCIYRK